MSYVASMDLINPTGDDRAFAQISAVSVIDVSERPPLLTSGELARRLGVATTTVGAWARRGWITPELRTAGGEYRWVEADVRAQLADRWPRRERDDG
jgi:hypothetical protein